MGKDCFFGTVDVFTSFRNFRMFKIIPTNIVRTNKFKDVLVNVDKIVKCKQ